MHGYNLTEPTPVALFSSILATKQEVFDVMTGPVVKLHHVEASHRAVKTITIYMSRLDG